MIDINLKKFKWSHIKIQEIEFWCVGYVYYENVLYNQENLASLFTQFINKSEFNQFLNRLYGNFTIVFKTDKNITLISDIVRSYPLLYKIEDDNIYVFDDDLDLQNKYGNFEIDLDNLKEYVCAGLVFGDKTVYKTVYGIQAAEKIVIDISTLKINAERYYMLKYSKIIDKEIDIPQLAKELDVVLLKIFQRVIDSAPNVNNWIIPLSGGHDSRLIAYYFHKLGVKNVICYSYGRKGSVQAKISKKVANALGYKWEFVEIDKKLVNSLHQENLIDKQIDYSFGGVSTVEMQNFLPMFDLINKNIISKNDIFVPGHALDALAGSKVYDFLLNISDENDIIDTLIVRNNIWNFDSSFLKIPIKEVLQSIDFHSIETLEFFGWQERQTKYIVNSVRVYDFFDFEWRLPFWDKEIVDFFSKIPLKYQVQRNLFFEFEKYIYEQEFRKIPFDENYKLNNFEKLTRIFNFFQRKLGSFFNYTVPYLLDEGYNRLFSNDKRKIKIYSKYLKEVDIMKYFEYCINMKVSEIHVNQVIRLEVLKKIINKNINKFQNS